MSQIKNELRFVPVNKNNYEIEIYRKLLSGEVDNAVKSKLPLSQIETYKKYDMPSDNIIYSLILDGVSVGFIEFSVKSYYITNMAHLLNLFILKEYRNKGLGSKAILFFKEYVKNIEGVDYITVDCNVDNKKFYEKNGFNTEVWLTKTCIVR